MNQSLISSIIIKPLKIRKEVALSHFLSLSQFLLNDRVERKWAELDVEISSHNTPALIRNPLVWVSRFALFSLVHAHTELTTQTEGHGKILVILGERPVSSIRKDVERIRWKFFDSLFYWEKKSLLEKKEHFYVIRKKRRKYFFCDQ
jgi:hypothetical protein